MALIMNQDNEKRTLENALLRRLIQRFIKAPPAIVSECEFRPAQTKEEFLACSRLVHNQYVRKQYMIPHESNLRLDMHQITQKSATFIALYQKRYILGAVTLVQDSPLGVPMDKIYKDDLNKLRDKKSLFGEVTMLAMNDELLEQLGLNQIDQSIILLHLFRKMLTHGRLYMHLDSLVACFHPRHELFYKALQFKPLAGLRSYEKVKGSPALAYILDIFELNRVPSEGLRKMFDLDTLSGNSTGEKPCYRFKFDEFFQIFINIDSVPKITPNIKITP